MAAGVLAAGAALSLAPIVASAFKSPAEKEAARLAEFQKNRAGELRNKLDANGRPIMDAEINRLNQLMSGNLGITDEAMQFAETGINRNVSQAMSGVSSLGGGLRQIGQVTQSANNALANLSAQDAQMTQANRLQLGTQLAGAEARAEAFNEIDPFMQMLTEAQALEGASFQNQYLAALQKSNRQAALWGGVGNFGSSMMGMGANMAINDKSFGDMFGKKVATANP
jgi:hypothetical protein